MNEQKNEKNIEPIEVEEEPIAQNTEQYKIEKKAKKEERKKKIYRRITVILLIVIVILILLLMQKCSSGVPILNPDYPPVSDDPNAETIEPNGDDKLDHEEGGGAVSLQFRDTLTIDLSDKKAYLYFANPSRSTQDMMLQIVIQDRVIVQSGRLRPGYQLNTVDLLKGAEKMLTEGIYEAKFMVYYYDPETNERAMVTTDAPVTISVEN